MCVSASASEPAAPSSSGANLVRQVLTGVVSSIYKVTAATSQVDPRLSPLWQVRALEPRVGPMASCRLASQSIVLW